MDIKDLFHTRLIDNIKNDRIPFSFASSNSNKNQTVYSKA